MINYQTSKTTKVLTWTSQSVASLIMFQTLYFKFSGAEESVYIFTKIGIEPWGRIATGIAELFASVLLLIPATAWLGALAGIGLMSGAIFFHLTTLGVEVMKDGGYLLILAITVFICSVFVLFMRREEILLLNKWTEKTH